MASSFEKSVKGATKTKAAPPKTKYIEHILIATHAGEAGVGEVFRALQFRLRDSTWTVAFKSLITIHLMIREGSPDSTLSFLSRHRNLLVVSPLMDAQTQGRNIRHYTSYLAERARAYRDTKVDWVRAKETRLEKLPVEKGLLRETEVVQRQIMALLKCQVLDEADNEITITVFRLLVLDLLSLFQVLNQAMINILGHFFEMSKTDAERAMEVYRHFTKQTDIVVQYLGVARQYEHHTRVEVPKLKHAPVNLGRQLEEYLKDPDFEIHRRQYLAELDARKKGGGTASSSREAKGDAGARGKTVPSTNDGSSVAETQPTPVAKGPDPDLIDFFDSIEQNQTTMAVNAQQQQQQQQQQQMTMGTPWPSNSPYDITQPSGQLPANGFGPQQTGFVNNGPFQQLNSGAFASQQQQVPTPLQPNFTGAGFGGYTPQPTFSPSGLSPIPQDSVASFQPPQVSAPMLTGFNSAQQSTNPFRQSMLTSQPTGMSIGSAFPGPASQLPMATGGLHRSSTNPFARPRTSAGNADFGDQAQSAASFQFPPTATPLQATATGTNPFAKKHTGLQEPEQFSRPQTSGAALLAQPTGTTNPFRQSAFTNHQTGLGWQHNQQPMGGGLDNVPTIPVFPRPSTGLPWQP